MHRLQMLVLTATLGAQFQPGLAHPQAGQDTATRQIEVRLGPESMWQPVWITKVEVGSQFLLDHFDPYNPPLPGQVVPGQNFIAGSDWLNGMTLYVINRTNKPIAWLSVGLMFPQTGNGRNQPVRIYHIQMGRMPIVDAVDGSGKPFPPGHSGSKPLGLQTGGRLTIHISDYMDKIDEYLKPAMPASAISEVNIQVDGCFFDDGMRYMGGAFSLPDPRRPGQWQYLGTRQYFPGDIHQYLPNVVTRRGERPQQ